MDQKAIIEEKLEKLLADDIPSIKSQEIIEYLEERRNIPVTVKFTTLDNSVFTQSYNHATTIGEIKRILSNVFNIPWDIIQIQEEDRFLTNDNLLEQFDSGLYNQLNFYLTSADPEYPISAQKAYKDITLPDIITVKVTYDDGSTKDIVVEVENKCILKPYIGGYRHKITQIEYLNGYSQTGPPKKKWESTHRDTQTYALRNRRNVTTYSTATQMQKEEIHIPNVTDVILTSGPYETADEREARLNVEGKCRLIQRYYRSWKLKNAIKELSDEYKRRVKCEQDEIDYLERMDAERKKRELIAKVFPRSKADFFMLYAMLENWKKAEIHRIKLLTCGASRLAEMYLLLEKEIKMLLSIEKQKQIVKKDRKIQKDLEFLKAISQPLSWNSKCSNIFVEMDTLETQRGRYYYEQYKAVCDRTQGIEGRLKTYLDVKMSLANHNNCEIGLEIVSLIDRACILISRGISDCHLEVLQQRIEACLLRHLQVKECCEGIAMREARVKQKLMKDNIFFCQRCNKYKTHDRFEISTTTTHLHVCKGCAFDDMVMEPHIDIQPYRYMLKCIRREERRQQAVSSVAFILTEKDICHLVTQIWQSHSAINGCPNLHELRMCRFFRDQDWAPWNCILLTYEETKTHLKIRVLEDIYDQEFLQHIYNKHILSKQYFKGAIQLDDYFQHIGKVDTRWNEIFEKKEFVAVNSKEKIFMSCH